MTTPGREGADRSLGVPLSTAAGFMAGTVALMWVLELVDQVSDNSLDQFGIHPRSESGLWEIFTAPWLHYGWAHLVSNSVPFFVLGLLILLAGWRRWLLATLAAVLGSGLLVWLVAPANSITLGASGVVFGWLLFVLVRGFFSRRLPEILLGVVIFFVYGGVLLGVLPGNDGVSWQGHLGGALGGVGAAWLSQRRPVLSRWSP